MKLDDVTIIGAGPAGIAAAIQLKRYGIEPVVFEKNEIGGLLKNANLVENYPGFPDGISGAALTDIFTKHLLQYVNVIKEEVIDVDYDNNIFKIISGKRNTFSKILVIATGTKANKLTDINIPDSVINKVHYEIYPILNISNKNILIIGAGDAGFDYGLNLSKHNDIIIINRNNTANCLPLLLDRANNSNQISVHNNTTIKEIHKANNDGIQIIAKNANGNLEFNVDYIVPAIGRMANLDIIDGNIKNKTNKLVDDGLLYYIGDVQNGLFRQAAISTGDGIAAAMKIYAKLKERRQ